MRLQRNHQPSLLTQLANIFILSGIILVTALPKPLSACASCSRGKGPDIFMKPSESIKSYLGLRDLTIANAITTKGTLTQNPLISKKSAFDIGLAYRLTHKAYVGFYGSYIINFSSKDQAAFFSNPSIGARYTAWKTNSRQSLLPDIQLLFSYTPKFVTARSETLTRDLVDVFGSDFHEVNIGYDIWNDKNMVLFGFTQSLNYGFAKEVLDEYVQPALNLASSLTTGMRLRQNLRFLAGYNHLYGHYRYDDGKKAPDSQMVNHGFFTTIDFNWSSRDNLKFSYTSGGHLNSFNTTTTQGFSLAYLRTWK